MPHINIKILGIVAFIVILTAGYAVYYTWTLGDSESDYSIICIGGHEYYRANFTNKGFLGIRLSNDGKPVRWNP